jgi:DNA (cytosine-5)-methyltransferase 3A
MNVLSLFDGMSCGQIALKELNISVGTYYASEIDRFAIMQTQLNFPNTIQIGDVRKVNALDLQPIDLLIGGLLAPIFRLQGQEKVFAQKKILKSYRSINTLN